MLRRGGAGVALVAVAGALSMPRRLARRRTRPVVMLDSSSSAWRDGDRVVVATSVRAQGRDFLGERGTVVDSWEKCQEDPHCCCAELADDGVAVTVRFDDGVVTYFADDELRRAPLDDNNNKADVGVETAELNPGA